LAKAARSVSTRLAQYFPEKNKKNKKKTFFLKQNDIIGWFGLWCLKPLSTIFQLYRGNKFYCWGKPKYLKKTINLS
jgi:hypothetical protein